MLSRKFQKGISRVFALLVAIALIAYALPMTALAAETTEPVTAEGTTVVQDGDVTVSQNSTTAVTATNGANVTVNGNVTSGVRNGAENMGVNATDSTVTVNGDVTTNGIQESTGVLASGSTVKVTGDIKTTGSDKNNEGIVTNNHANVTAGNITTRGYQSEGIFGFESTVNAGDITIYGDEAWGVRAYYNARVNVGDVNNSNVRHGGGILAEGGATVTAASVTTGGTDSTGVYGDANGIAVVNGNVVTNGANANAIQILNNNAQVRVVGDVTSKQGYGIVIELIPTDLEGYSGPATVTISGTLSGGKGTIAILPYGNVFDVSRYQMPAITAGAIAQGLTIVVVQEDGDGNLVEVTGDDAQALIEAVMNNIRVADSGVLQTSLPPFPPTETTFPPQTVKVASTTNATLPPITRTSAKTTTDTVVSPKTGDDTNATPWLAVIIAAGAVLAGTGWFIYKKRA